jgi:hypothetical protein
MRAHRFMLGFISGILLTVGSVQAAFAEEYRGTMEQQMACTPDVWRLCGDQIPDVNRIVACLQRNTPNLSGACRAVFESNNSVPPSRGHAAAPPPARIAPPPRPNDDDDE